MKTTLNRWLKIKHEINPDKCLCSQATLDHVIDDAFLIDGCLWWISVLDDGTAITYCADE